MLYHFKTILASLSAIFNLAMIVLTAMQMDHLDHPPLAIPTPKQNALSDLLSRNYTQEDIQTISLQRPHHQYQHLYL